MDRFSNYIHRINLGDKRNLIASICSGILFAIGWWIAIDAAFAYPSNEQLLKSSHTCGALATLALIMINTVTNNQIRGDAMESEGFFGKTLARVWVFIGFLMSFGSLIAAFWILFAYYIFPSSGVSKTPYHSDSVNLTTLITNSGNVTRSAVPGVEIVLQNVFIFASTLMFKFGRNEELWGN